jgi:hypothetical protein
MVPVMLTSSILAQSSKGQPITNGVLGQRDYLGLSDPAPSSVAKKLSQQVLSAGAERGGAAAGNVVGRLPRWSQKLNLASHGDGQLLPFSR